MNNRALRAGKAFIEFTLSDGQVRKQLRALQARLAGVGNSLRNFGAIGVAAGTAITTVFAGALKVFSSVGDELNKMSLRTGFSAQALSELAFAAGVSGAGMMEIVDASRDMSRNLFNASKGAAGVNETLEDLGLSIEHLLKLSPEEQFIEITTALSKIESPTRRVARAMEIFGEIGSRLLPMLSGGAEGISALRQEARELGITLGDEDAQAAADLTDALTRFGLQLKAITIGVGAAVSGEFTEYLGMTRTILRSTIDWVRANGPLIRTIATVGTSLLAAGTLLLGLSAAVTASSYIVGALATGLGALLALFTAIVSPIGLVTAGLLAGVSAMVVFTDAGTTLAGNTINLFSGMGAIAKDMLGSMAALLVSGQVEAAAGVMWHGLRLLWLEGTQWLREIWFKMVYAIRDSWIDLITEISKMAVSIGSNEYVVKLLGFSPFGDNPGGLLSELDKMAARDKADNSRSLGGNVLGARKDLADARQAWELAREAADAIVGASRVQRNHAGQIPLAGIVEEVLGVAALRSGQMGSLNPAMLLSLQQIGSGNSAAERAAKAGEKQVDLLEDIRDNTDEGGAF